LNFERSRREHASASPQKIGEIALHIFGEELKKVAFLRQQKDFVLAQLLLKLQLAQFGPGDFIYRKGPISHSTFL
jgi:hypothetical protein